MFYIGQNFKHVLMTYSFLETFDRLLINSRYLVFGVYTKEILYVNTNFMGNQS